MKKEKNNCQLNGNVYHICVCAWIFNCFFSVFKWELLRHILLQFLLLKPTPKYKNPTLNNECYLFIYLLFLFYDQQNM